MSAIIRSIVVVVFTAAAIAGPTAAIAAADSPWSSPGPSSTK